MPRKMNDATHGDKVIELYSLLIFSRDSHSLGALARQLQCSKQTVLRLMEVVRRKLPMLPDRREGNRLFFQVDRARIVQPKLRIGRDDMAILDMCRAFTENLLGRDHYRRAVDSLRKARVMLPDRAPLPDETLFGCYTPGSIDYTPHQQTIGQLTEAMETRSVCRLAYRKPGAAEDSVFDVMPLKIFARHDTVYLHARLYLEGERPRPGTFDPLLAVHRIRKVRLRNKKFEFPPDYDFDAAYNRTFGVVKGESFRLKVVFSGWAVDYARERHWSPDQEFRDLPGGELELSFTASSEWEAASWVLSYRGAARVLEPEWLAKEVRRAARRIAAGHAVPRLRGPGGGPGSGRRPPSGAGTGARG